jgi:hypothetical protein
MFPRLSRLNTKFLFLYLPKQNIAIDKSLNTLERTFILQEVSTTEVIKIQSKSLNSVNQLLDICGTFLYTRARKHSVYFLLRVVKCSLLSFRLQQRSFLNRIHIKQSNTLPYITPNTPKTTAMIIKLTDPLLGKGYTVCPFLEVLGFYFWWYILPIQYEGPYAVYVVSYQN